MSRDWKVREAVAYRDSADAVTKDVETGLSKRRAIKSAAEWQDASNRNRLMVSGLAPGASLPTVTYTAVQS